MLSKKPIPKKPKKKTVSKAKAELWKVFSEYIRRRDADEWGNVSCVTCGKRGHWKSMQAGHFVPRARGNATYFEPTNCHAQCFRCNINLGGNGSAYALYIMKRYGGDYVKKLEDMAKVMRKFTVEELEGMKEKYRLDKIEL